MLFHLMWLFILACPKRMPVIPLFHKEFHDISLRKSIFKLCGSSALDQNKVKKSNFARDSYWSFFLVNIVWSVWGQTLSASVHTHTTPNNSSQLLSHPRLARLELITPTPETTKSPEPMATLCLPCQCSSSLPVTYVYLTASIVLLIQFLCIACLVPVCPLLKKEHPAFWCLG